MAHPSAKPHPTVYGRLPDIVGQREVTQAEAARNRKSGRGPKRARPAIQGILSVSPATFWRLVAQGVFTPIKLSPRVTVFDLDEIRDWVASRSPKARGIK